METQSGFEEKLEGKEILEYNEIKRKYDVFAIGDLNGSYDALIHNLRTTNCIDENLNWVGKDARIVFLGDILADRNSDGEKIYLFLHDLKKQAKIQKGKITVLCGNHDDFALSLLLERGVAQNISEKRPVPNSIDPLEICVMNGFQGMGIFQLFKFADCSTDTKGSEILKKLKETEKGQNFLSELAELKILHQIDDTLFSHCPLSYRAMEWVAEKGVKNINKIFQKFLKHKLFGKPKKISKKDEVDFESLRTIFLSTDNRLVCKDEELSKKLREIGINYYIYGHNSNGGEINHIGSGLFSVDIDYKTFKDPSLGDPSHSSVCKISKDNGQISIDSGTVIRPDTDDFYEKNKEYLEGIRKKERRLIFDALRRRAEKDNDEDDAEIPIDISPFPED